MPFRASAAGAESGPGSRCPPSLPTTSNWRAKNCASCWKKSATWKWSGTASNGLEALDLIEKLDPALAFLDIQMPGLDGLGVVRRLRENQIDPPHIIFSTAFDQFAVEAFKLEAMDYLLKPVDRERLAATLARARRAVADRLTEPVVPGRRASLRSRNCCCGAARAIWSSAGGTRLRDDRQRRDHAGGARREGQSNFRTIEELQAALDPDMFWRAHRSYLVNVNRIREVVPWFKSTYQLRMDDKKASEIPVSRLQSRKLREMLNL
jgi:two-component system response regulator LytT